MFANAAALSSVLVVFVSLLSVVILLCVRMWSEVVGVSTSRLVSRMLEGAIIVLFLLFILLVIVRFTTIG